MMKQSKPKSSLKGSKTEKFKPSKNKDMSNLIKSALTEFLQDENNRLKYSKRNYTALKNVVQEFLNSFIIMGYTPDHEPVEIVFSHNQQEAHALTTLVNDFFDRTNGNIDESD